MVRDPVPVSELEGSRTKTFQVRLQLDFQLQHDDIRARIAVGQPNRAYLVRSLLDLEVPQLLRGLLLY